MRYELAEYEWVALKAMLPNKPRGVPRVNDRRVLNGIFWVLRSGAPWRDLPDHFGPYTTCYNRFVRWRRAGVWSRIIDALAAAHDAAVQMIDTSIVRVHQHGACITRNQRQSMGRSRGGLTSKIHAVVDSNGLPVRLALSPGEAHDVRLAGKTVLSSEIRVNAACRPWLRRGLDQEACHEEGRVGQHPAEKQSQRSDLLQPLSLPRSQPGRAVLQQDQTLSSGGDALRQARRQLPCLCPTRIYPAMACRAL
ncbi:MAG: hypothetical protein QOI05_2583 [Bradyrhizobium sp.]|nr:hypothetical protein [Bradyrhizobium sp.]